jgi:3-hydroxyacyl-CoA dehydrogenase
MTYCAHYPSEIRNVKNVYAQIASWHQQYGERWAPSRLLRELAETNTPFREAKPAPFA